MKQMKKALIAAGLSETPKEKKPGEDTRWAVFHIPSAQYLMRSSRKKGVFRTEIALFKNKASAGHGRDVGSNFHNTLSGIAKRRNRPYVWSYRYDGYGSREFFFKVPIPESQCKKVCFEFIEVKDVNEFQKDNRVG